MALLPFVPQLPRLGTAAPETLPAAKAFAGALEPWRTFGEGIARVWPLLVLGGLTIGGVMLYGAARRADRD